MNNKVYRLTACALMAALMCILGPFTIPIGPIPVSLTVLVIYLAVYMIGGIGATISVVVYLLLGAVGIPVFSGFQGGLAKLAGPTGGYLIGYIFLALISGLALKISRANMWITALGMIIATAVLYIFGTVWFVLQMDVTVAYACSVCVFPFIPLDLVKIAIAAVLGKTVRNALVKSGLLAE